jgi:hypothetical protein
MTLAEFYRYLSYGELINLSIANDGDGSIVPEAQARIASYTEHALKLLYTRFAHNRHFVILETQEAIKSYQIKSTHAVSDATVGNEAVRFIKDSVDEPFQGNVLKILSLVPIADEENIDPEEVILNDNRNPDTVKFLKYDTLYFKEPVEGKQYVLEYQTGHPAFSLPPDPNQEIELHPVLHDALAKKVAAKVFGTMNGQENLTKSQLLNSEYEDICKMVESQDLLQLSTTHEFKKLTNRGWV